MNASEAIQEGTTNRARARRDHGGWPDIRYAWYVLALLTLAYALAILDRVSIALLIEPLQASLHIDDTQFGLLQGLAFSMVYSLLGLPLGLLSDRRRRMTILVAGLALWSLATIGCSLATTFHELFFARMLVGVGEAALVPVASSLIADFFAPAIRPKAYGIFVTGSSLGTAAAMALGGLFLGWADGLIAGLPRLFGAMEPWQIVFILCGAPGLVLALLLAVTGREPVRQGGHAPTQGLSVGPLLALFRQRPAAFGLFMLGSVLNLVCVYAIVGWFPALFIRAHGWDAGWTGKVLGMVGLPVSIFAALNSGWVIAWLTRRGHADAPVLCAMGCALSMVVFGTLACLAPSGGWALVGYALNALFVNWNTSAVYSGFAQITPNSLRAQIIALQTIASGLIALTLGNFLVGYLSDTLFTGPAGIAWSLGCVFFVCGLAALGVLAGARRGFRAAARDLSGKEA
ncbi:MFS transporter [Novosphingobium profundi]|uniref:MFS transporter n=1 Tax=Novosphingobium profundi TaxID=1774954 RepID=UPI001BD9B8D6|nr:MFS transporter [Novosphingobium profundi]MBT0669234.1 MFS transporter [Novosphingobium profundi]